MIVGFAADRPMEQHMIDRLLSGGLHVLVMALISGASAGGLVCAHWAVLRLLSGALPGAAFHATAALALSLAAFFLIRHRNDLVDR